jgi:glycosyltransferase involved in cell wall biosynthesis
MEVMTEALLAGLKGESALCTRNIDTQASRSLAEKGGKHQLRKSLRGAFQTARVLELMLRFRPDVVYLPLTSSPSFLGFVRDSLLMAPGLICRKKLVVHLHNGSYGYAQASGLKGWFVRSVLNRIDLAIVLGPRLASVFNGMIPPSRIACIPNGVDDRPFAAARARRGGAPRPGPRRRLLFVGLMHRDKGFRDLIDAIPLVPEGEFIFAGEWPSMAQEKVVRALLRERGVEERANFVGVITGDAKYDLFLSADIFVLPSYYEGQPVVILEALAAGLPIVCTNCGAMEAAVHDGWNGFFVPPASPEALAKRLNELVRDSEARRAMGERSRRLYEENFTLSHFLERISCAIQQCAAPSGASR